MGEQLYKVLVNGASCHGGSMKWPLPKGKRPGAWVKIDGPLSICARGIHLTKEPSRWLKVGCAIYEAEAKGIAAGEDDKCVCSSARLTGQIETPEWWTKTEQFIASLKDVEWMSNKGEADQQWKMFDTWHAAWDAARNAARDAARDAARNAARNAAWDAAWDAARDAAWNAARDAARNAAWNAARDSARDAADQCSINVVCDGLKIAQKHRKAISDRWEVWTRGYGLVAEVVGVFYVYRKVA